MRTLKIGLLGLALAFVGCASDDDATRTTGAAGAGGTAGAAGAGGTAGGAGAAGAAGTVGAAGAAAHTDSADPSGVYEDDFGFSHRVDNAGWTTMSDAFTFVEFDSKLDTATAENGATNQFNPGKFSRFDWATDTEGQLRYCQTRYDAETSAEAAAASRADDSDWAKGCGGFAWSVLNGPAILGAYTDDWGGSHEVTGQAWTMGGTTTSKFDLLVLSNAKRHLIAQNAATNQYSPGKFSRFDWTLDVLGALYYCQTRYDAETAADALASAAADATVLDKGCGGFAWSKLSPSAR